MKTPSYAVAVLGLLLGLLGSVRADDLPLVDQSGLALSCTKPMALDRICPCLVGSEKHIRCSFKGPEEIHGARPVLVEELADDDSGGEGSDRSVSHVYLIASGPGGWRVIQHLADQREHGERSDSMHPSAQREQRLGPARVYRIDYRVQHSDCPRGYGEDLPPCEGSDDTVALVCPLEGIANAPRCTLKATVKCDRWEGEADKKIRRVRGTADLQLGTDGKAQLVRKTPATGKTCLDKLGAHTIW